MALIPTSLDRIVLAAQAQLMASLAWPAERVLVVDPAKLNFHPQGDAYLCLWPDLENVNLPVFQGAGRLDTRLTERLLVNVRTRTALDDAPTAAVWLTDPGLGHIASARQLAWNALAGMLLFDGAGGQLTAAPIVPVNGGRPKLDPDEKEWGESALAFDVPYLLKLTVPPY